MTIAAVGAGLVLSGCGQWQREADLGIAGAEPAVSASLAPTPVPPPAVAQQPPATPPRVAEAPPPPPAVEAPPVRVAEAERPEPEPEPDRTRREPERPEPEPSSVAATPSEPEPAAEPARVAALDPPALSIVPVPSFRSGADEAVAALSTEDRDPPPETEAADPPRIARVDPAEGRGDEPGDAPAGAAEPEDGVPAPEDLATPEEIVAGILRTWNKIAAAELSSKTLFGVWPEELDGVPPSPSEMEKRTEAVLP